MKAAEASAEMSLEEIFELVRPELNQVETALRERVRSAVPVVEQINQYIHESGGKRLRPTLTLLCSKLCRHEGPEAIQLGVILELIHVASLVHDDIIDNARVRRGRPSVHAQWGNQITVLMGDWLYMTSFHMAFGLEKARVVEILVNITRQLVEGELMQLQHNGNLDISREEQLQICSHKTAYLFGGCGRLAAVVSGESTEVEEHLRTYGESLGMAFQLVDDLLDYTSTELETGKPVLKDLEEGKVTLPIIYLLERATPSEVEFVQSVVHEGDFSPENKGRIIQLAERHGVIQDVRQEAEAYAARATAALSGFAPGPALDALVRIAAFVLERKR